MNPVEDTPSHNIVTGDATLLTTDTTTSVTVINTQAVNENYIPDVNNDDYLLNATKAPSNASTIDTVTMDTVDDVVVDTRNALTMDTKEDIMYTKDAVTMDTDEVAVMDTGDAVTMDTEENVTAITNDGVDTFPDVLLTSAELSCNTEVHTLPLDDERTTATVVHDDGALESAMVLDHG